MASVTLLDKTLEHTMVHDRAKVFGRYSEVLSTLPPAQVAGFLARIFLHDRSSAMLAVAQKHAAAFARWTEKGWRQVLGHVYVHDRASFLKKLIGTVPGTLPNITENLLDLIFEHDRGGFAEFLFTAKEAQQPVLPDGKRSTPAHKCKKNKHCSDDSNDDDDAINDSNDSDDDDDDDDDDDADSSEDSDGPCSKKRQARIKKKKSGRKKKNGGKKKQNDGKRAGAAEDEELLRALALSAEEAKHAPCVPQPPLLRAPGPDEPPPLLNPSNITAVTPTDREEEQCTICLTNRRNVLNTACGHVCVCLECVKGESFREKTCLVCRKPVTSWLVVSP